MPNIHYPGGLIITGTDGVAPIYEPDGVWKIWGLHEIFTGHEGSNKYVPKVNDYVINHETNEAWIVISIDSTTLIAELRKIRGLPIKIVEDDDRLLSTDPCIRDETYRVYLDTSVNPYRLTVDARHKVYGSMSHHAKIFRGSRLQKPEEVVSMIFDQYGQLLSDNIPLELAEMDGVNNYVTKCVPPCHTTYALPDGELVTVVIYDDVGVVTQVREMIVENTSVIRQTDTSVKYIKGISLDSPFLTENDPTLIKYPLNVPVRGLNLFGIVEYSDGSTRRLPVDGTKFQVLGLTDYVATIVGYRFDFTLRYSIGSDEIAIDIKNDSNVDMSIKGDRFITRRFKGEVVKADNAYSVKLFGYPSWVDDLNGYRMDFYLMNLERSYCINVTPFVKYNENRVPFNGLLYGVAQRISVSINLKEASITNKDYIHTQVIDIQLQRNGGDKTGYPWSVGFEINQFPYYGIDNFAQVSHINQNLKRVNISLEESNFETWLERIYRRAKPLYDETREPGPLEPDYIRIRTPNREFTFPISRWNQQLEINDTLKETDNIYVVFIKRTNDTDLFLGVSALPVLMV